MSTYYVCRLKDTSHYFAATRDEAGNYVYTDTSEVVAPEWVDGAMPCSDEQHADRVAAFLDRPMPDEVVDELVAEHVSRLEREGAEIWLNG